MATIEELSSSASSSPRSARQPPSPQKRNPQSPGKKPTAPYRPQQQTQKQQTPKQPSQTQQTQPQQSQTQHAQAQTRGSVSAAASKPTSPKQNTTKPTVNNINVNNVNNVNPTNPDPANTTQGNTSAEMDILMTAEGVSTPAAANQSASFDSHTTQKASGVDVTNILQETPQVPQKTRLRPKLPNIGISDKPLLPKTVLTENTSPEYQPETPPESDGSNERHGDTSMRVVGFDSQGNRIYRFMKRNEAYGSDVSSNIAQAAAEARASRAKGYQAYMKRHEVHVPSAEDPPLNLEAIRRQMEAQRAKESRQSRERSFSSIKEKSRGKKMAAMNTPRRQDNKKVNIPVDETDEGLFNTICELQAQFESSEQRVSELENALKTALARISDQKVELDNLQQVQTNERGQNQQSVETLHKDHQAAIQKLLENHQQEMQKLQTTLATKDGELQAMTVTVNELNQNLQAVDHVKFAEMEEKLKSLTIDYEHYKDQCYKKDSLISSLEAKLKHEGKIEELERDLAEKEKRLIKTELRLGQQALEQDHVRQKLDVERRNFIDRDEQERLRRRLAELESRGRSRSRSRERSSRHRSRTRSRTRSRSRDSRSSRSSRSSGRSSRRRRSAETPHSSDRSVSRNRDHFTKLEHDYLCCGGKPRDLRADALEKIIEFLHKQKSKKSRAHVDSCYNAPGTTGSNVRFDGLDQGTINKLLQDFLDKDENLLKDMLYSSDSQKLQDFLASIYNHI